MIHFLKIKQSDIDEAESLLGFNIPKPLTKFYLKYGYGNLPSKYNSNLFMHPVTAANFRLMSEEFENFPDIDFYAEYNKSKFVFFEANETAFFAVNIDGTNENVYYRDIVIANSIKEFLVKMVENEDYYLSLT